MTFDEFTSEFPGEDMSGLILLGDGDFINLTSDVYSLTDRGIKALGEYEGYQSAKLYYDQRTAALEAEIAALKAERDE